MAEHTLLMFLSDESAGERIASLGGRPRGPGVWIVPACPAIRNQLEQEASARGDQAIFLGSLDVAPLTGPWRH